MDSVVRNFFNQFLSEFFHPLHSGSVEVSVENGAIFKNLKFKADGINEQLERGGADVRIRDGKVGQMRICYTAFPGIVTVQMQDVDIRMQPNAWKTIGKAIAKKIDGFLQPAEQEDDYYESYYPYELSNPYDPEYPSYHPMMPLPICPTHNVPCNFVPNPNNIGYHSQSPYHPHRDRAFIDPADVTHFPYLGAPNYRKQNKSPIGQPASPLCPNGVCSIPMQKLCCSVPVSTQKLPPNYRNDMPTPPYFLPHPAVLNCNGQHHAGQLPFNVPHGREYVKPHRSRQRYNSKYKNNLTASAPHHNGTYGYHSVPTNDSNADAAPRRPYSYRGGHIQNSKVYGPPPQSIDYKTQTPQSQTPVEPKGFHPYQPHVQYKTDSNVSPVIMTCKPIQEQVVTSR